MSGARENEPKNIFRVSFQPGLCALKLSIGNDLNTSESTKALQEQNSLLGNSGGSVDQVDSLETRRLKDDMMTMKKKLMGK